IPWTDFLRTGGRPERGERWKFALCRYDYSVDFEGPELSTCAPLKGHAVPDFHRFEEYATLRFVGPKAPGNTGLTEHIPMTTSRVIGSPDPPPPYRVKKVYPDLPLHWPEIVTAQPGSDQLVLIELASPYDQSHIRRF